MPPLPLPALAPHSRPPPPVCRFVMQQEELVQLREDNERLRHQLSVSGEFLNLNRQLNN